MASTEELLQELIELQREEMKRTRRYRITRILLGTLPTIIFLVLTVWGSVVLYHSLTGVMQNFPDLLEQQGFGQMQNFRPSF